MACRKDNRPWTPEALDRLVSLHADGLPGKDIARRLDRTERSVNHKLYVLGVVRPKDVPDKPPSQPWTREQKAWALANFRTDPQARALAHLITGIPA